MPFHRAGAYDGFDSISEPVKHYKRCRVVKHFVLSYSGVQKENPVCIICGRPLLSPPPGEKVTRTGHYGNRCQYQPRTKRTAVMHYRCAWSSLLQNVFAIKS